MPASVRSEVSTAISSNVTTHTYDFPPTILAGDPITCIGSMDDDNNAIAASGWPAGWVSLFEAENPTGANDMTGFAGYLEADGTEDNGTFDVTSASGEKSCAHTVAFQDAADVSVDPPEVPAADAAGTSASPDPTAITGLTSDDYLFFAMAAIANTDTFTGFPSGYTGTGSLDSGGGGPAALGWAFLSTTGVTAEDAGAFAITSVNWVAQNIVIYPASGSPTFSVSVSEQVDLSGSFSESYRASESISEAVDLDELQNTIAIIVGNVSNQAEFSDDYQGLLQTIVSVTGQVNFAETQTSVVVISGTVVESSDLTDSAQVSLIAVRNAAEIVEVDDASSSIASRIGQVSEPIDFAETLTGSAGGAISADVSEAVNLATSVISVKTAAAAIIEAVELGESWAVAAQMIADSSSQVDFGSSESPGGSISAALSESFDLLSLFSNTVVTRAAGTSAIEFQTSELAVMSAIAAVTDVSDYADVYTSVLQVADSVSEAIVLADIIVFSSDEIAAAAVIMVEARRRNITAEPRNRRSTVPARNRRIAAEKLN